MKRLAIILMTVLTMATTASAISYKTARDEAFFLTDKMAYELNLTADQYNAVYEINLDYIMVVENYGDLFGSYWTRRNSELSYVLSSAQYHAFIKAEYFYRPISFVSNKFVFPIYNRYEKNRYYYMAPTSYDIYRGANRYYEHSPYHGRDYGFDKDRRPNDKAQPLKPGQMPPPSNPGMGNPSDHKPGDGYKPGDNNKPGNGYKPGNGNKPGDNKKPTTYPYTKKESVNLGKEHQRTMTSGKKH